MSDTSPQPERLFGVVPRSGRGLAIFGAMLIAAFVLGWLLSGGPTEAPMEAGHDRGESTVSAWTCSMHPQIQLPGPGKCPLCSMDLIPVTTDVDDSIDPSQLRLTATAARLAQIQTAVVRRGDATAELPLYGRLTYDETRLSVITAWAPGRLDKLYVDYTGASIAEGDPLASFYSPELLAAREELIQAKRAVNNGGSDLLQATAQATLDAAREKLRLYGLSNQQVRAMEEGSSTDDHLTIYSPTSGIVVDKQAVEGMYVKPGTPLFTIADLSKLWVVFDAYETDLPWLSVGQEVSFNTRSQPGKSFEATITFIDPTIDATTRTTGVRAEVDNSAGLLKPDMFARGSFTTELDGVSGYQDKQLLLIPATAPLITGKRAVVYVELTSDDGRLFEGREVILGPRAGEFYVVVEGLEEGELVVMNGAFKIDAELQIRARPSMMSPASEDGGGPDRTESDEQPAAPTRSRESEPIELSGRDVAALNDIYNTYFELQTSLADDDVGAAKAAAQKLVAEVADFDHSIFPASVHWPWTEQSMEIARQSMAAAGGTDIEAVRKSFDLISNAMIELHKVFGHSDGRHYYLAFCPMAFDNRGSYWLQTDSIINNPYFGEMMLRCGEIKESMASLEVEE